MRISDWSSDVCSSDLRRGRPRPPDELRRLRFAEPFLQRPGDGVQIVGDAENLMLLPAGDDVHGAGLERRLEHLVGTARRGRIADLADAIEQDARSEEHTSELQSLMRISYAVFCLNKNKNV